MRKSCWTTGIVEAVNGAGAILDALNPLKTIKVRFEDLP